MMLMALGKLLCNGLPSSKGPPETAEAWTKGGDMTRGDGWAAASVLCREAMFAKPGKMASGQVAGPL